MNPKYLQVIPFQSKSAQNQKSELITGLIFSSAEIVALFNDVSHVNNTEL